MQILLLQNTNRLALRKPWHSWEAITINIVLWNVYFTEQFSQHISSAKLPDFASVCPVLFPEETDRPNEQCP